MAQRVSYWTRRVLELVVIGYVVCILFVAGAEAMHKPVIADKVHRQ